MFFSYEVGKNFKGYVYPHIPPEKSTGPSLCRTCTPELPILRPASLILNAFSVACLTGMISLTFFCFGF